MRNISIAFLRIGALYMIVYDVSALSAVKYPQALTLQGLGIELCNIIQQ